MRKEDILPFVTTGMDLEHIMLSKKRKTEKGCTVLYHLHMEAIKGKPVKNRE